MTSPRKEKTHERHLVEAIIGSFIFALMMFGACAWAYLHRTDLVIKNDSVPIAVYNSVLDLTLFLAIQMPLYIGIAFFCVAYTVWKAYRKYKLAKKDGRGVL